MSHLRQDPDKTNQEKTSAQVDAVLNTLTDATPADPAHNVQHDVATCLEDQTAEDVKYLDIGKALEAEYNSQEFQITVAKQLADETRRWKSLRAKAKAKYDKRKNQTRKDRVDNIAFIEPSVLRVKTKLLEESYKNRLKETMERFS